MAKAASKKLAAQNAMMMRILTYGFLISNVIHLLIVFGPFRNKRLGIGWPLTKYIVTEGIAAILGISLAGMAKQGDDLGQHGLTAYMFDIIYVTWFVHITTALVWSKFWYTYLAIPVYAAFIAYTKLLVPFVFGGNDPLRRLAGALLGSAGGASNASSPVNGESSGTQQATSKRQAKLQKRMERGDPRVQSRQQH